MKRTHRTIVAAMVHNQYVPGHQVFEQTFEYMPNGVTVLSRSEPKRYPPNEGIGIERAELLLEKLNKEE